VNLKNNGKKFSRHEKTKAEIEWEYFVQKTSNQYTVDAKT